MHIFKKKKKKKKTLGTIILFGYTKKTAHKGMGVAAPEASRNDDVGLLVLGCRVDILGTNCKSFSYCSFPERNNDALEKEYVYNKERHAEGQCRENELVWPSGKAIGP